MRSPDQIYDSDVSCLRKLKSSIYIVKYKRIFIFTLGDLLQVSLSGSWDWISFPSLDPKADSENCRLELLRVDVVFLFFTFHFNLFLSIYYFHRSQGQHTYNRPIGFWSQAWAFCSSLVPSGPKCVSARSECVNKVHVAGNSVSSVLDRLIYNLILGWWSGRYTLKYR